MRPTPPRHDPTHTPARALPRNRRRHGVAALEDQAAATIRQSHTLIETCPDPLAERFYQILLDRAPQLFHLFPTDSRSRRDQLQYALIGLLHRIDPSRRDQRRQLAARLADLGRDHRKYGITADHYDLATDALLAGLTQIHGLSWTPQLATAWNNTCAAVTHELLVGAGRGPALWLGRVVDHRRPAPDLASVYVQALDPIPHQAGQYLSVEAPQRPGLWRYLSPTEPARPDGVLRFLVRAIPGGQVSPTLVTQTRTNDTWRIGPALGQLQRILTTGHDLLMLASGTGLASISALIAELDQTPNPPRTHLYLRTRDSAELDTLTSTTAIGHQRPWLTLTPIIPGGRAQGSSVVEAALHDQKWDRHDIVVCGPPAMQKHSIQRLRDAAIPVDNIHSDPLPVTANQP